MPRLREDPHPEILALVEATLAKLGMRVEVSSTYPGHYEGHVIRDGSRIMRLSLAVKQGHFAMNVQPPDTRSQGLTGHWPKVEVDDRDAAFDELERLFRARQIIDGLMDEEEYLTPFAARNALETMTSARSSTKEGRLSIGAAKSALASKDDVAAVAFVRDLARSPVKVDRDAERTRLTAHYADVEALKRHRVVWRTNSVDGNLMQEGAEYPETEESGFRR